MSPETGLLHKLNSRRASSERFSCISVPASPRITSIARGIVMTAASTVSTQSITQANVLPALSSIVAGVLLIFAVGFSHISVAHNAAHDTRHAAAFPCH